MNIKKIALLSIFTSSAFAVNYLENLVSPPIPGIHLGLANIFPLVALILFGIREAFFVACARLVLSYFLTGNVLALSCAAVGTICSLTVEYVLYVWLRFTSPVFISLVGAWFFNLGQLVTVYYLLTSAKIFLLAPWILSVGVITGLAVGYWAEKLLKICKRVI